MGISYTIPDHLLDQLYEATNTSPNNDVFTQNQLAKRPIPPLALDNITSWVSDCLQDAQNQINKAVISGLGVAGTQYQLLTFDAAGNLQVSNLQDLLTALNPLSFDGSNILSNTIYGSTLRANSLPGSALKDNSLSGSKITAGSLPISRLSTPASSGILAASTTNGGYWYPLRLDDWQIAVKKPDNNGPTAMSLVDVWSGTGGTFDGGKITPNTITGDQIAPNTITGDQIAPNSVPLTDMVSSKQPSIVAGTSSNNSYYEVILKNWQLPCLIPGNNGPTPQTLDTIWDNTAGTFDGAKITAGSLTGTQMQDNSVPLSKIQSPGPLAPFALASVNSYCSLNKSFNIAAVTKNGTGLYRVAFANPASSANAVVIAVTSDGGGVNTVVSDQSTQAVVIRLMNLQGQNVNGGFDMIVYDF